MHKMESIHRHKRTGQIVLMDVFIVEKVFVDETIRGRWKCL
jgi:hypothetical protein